MLMGKLIKGGVDIVGRYKVVLFLFGGIIARFLGAPASFNFLHVELFLAGRRVTVVENSSSSSYRANGFSRRVSTGLFFSSPLQAS